MPNAVLCAYGRSPFTLANKGELAKTRPDDLLAQVIKGMLAKTKVNAADIEDLLVGCAFPEGEQGLNIGRMAVFLAGLPLTVGGATLHRLFGPFLEDHPIAAGKNCFGA